MNLKLNPKRKKKKYDKAKYDKEFSATQAGRKSRIESQKKKRDYNYGDLHDTSWMGSAFTDYV